MIISKFRHRRLNPIYKYHPVISYWRHILPFCYVIHRRRDAPIPFICNKNQNTFSLDSNNDHTILRPKNLDRKTRYKLIISIVVIFKFSLYTRLHFHDFVHVSCADVVYYRFSLRPTHFVSLVTAIMRRWENCYTFSQTYITLLL